MPFTSKQTAESEASTDPAEDEEFFFEVKCRVVRRNGKTWFVDTAYLKKQLTPHLIKV